MDCLACGAPGAEYSCSRCRRVRFCGEACQRAAWRKHKLDCRGTPAGVDEAEVPAGGAAGGLLEAAACAKRRPLLVSVYPNVGTLQGDVTVRLEPSSTLESFREAVGGMVLRGVAGSDVRLFGTEGDEILSLDGLRCHASQGVVASDGPDFRPRHRAVGSDSPALVAAIAQPRRYDPTLVDCQAPRIRGDDPELPRLLRCHVPVIVEASGIAGKAPDLWGFDYLARHLDGTDSLCVLQADAEAADRFMYYSLSEEHNPCGYPVRRATERRPMSFAVFRRELAEAQKRRTSGRPAPYLYLQTALFHRKPELPAAGPGQPVDGFGETWGRRLRRDIVEGFELRRLRELAGGRELDNCQLFCGVAGGYTPMHFDSEDNLFLQVRGWKRILLFHPKYFSSLYPFPMHHPQDRSSRVDFQAPDTKQFPRFAGLQGCAMEAHVGPGDILHIPPCWWHQVEMLPCPPGDECVSLNFWYSPPTWYRGDPASGTVTWDDPLTGHGRVLFLRYVEQVIAETAGPQHVREVLEACLGQRPPPAAGPLRAAVDAAFGSIRTVFPLEAASRSVLLEVLEGRFAGLWYEG